MLAEIVMTLIMTLGLVFVWSDVFLDGHCGRQQLVTKKVQWEDCMAGVASFTPLLPASGTATIS